MPIANRLIQSLVLFSAALSCGAWAQSAPRHSAAPKSPMAAQPEARPRPAALPQGAPEPAMSPAVEVTPAGRIHVVYAPPSHEPLPLGMASLTAD